MRLRDISEIIREPLERDPESLFSGDVVHALIQDITDVQSVYRPVAGGGKKGGIVPWMAFGFEPFVGLIEPFNICPGRFWGLLRMHRQPSGLPEVVVHIARDMPSASTPLAPDLYVSFSHSPKVETIIRKSGKDPLTLRFFHRGNLMRPDRTRLDAEICIPRFADALPEGYVEDGIPGLVDLDGVPVLYVGDLVFYNQGRTFDRGYLRNFLLNCTATAVVARYVREQARKES